MPGDDRIAASLKYLASLEYQARGFSFLPTQPARSILAGAHGSRLRGRGLSFEELRRYRVGDDIRSLEWKVTHRTGKPHVRVFAEERERIVHLLVDQRSNMFFGSRRAMKSVVAAELAALGAWRVLAVKDRLGATVLDDQRQRHLPARRSREAVMNLLASLARTNAALLKPSPDLNTPTDHFNAALRGLATSLPHDALLIIISDGEGWDEVTDRLIKRFALHNDVVLVQVYDPAEMTLPEADTLVVTDGRQQLSVSGQQGDLSDRLRDSVRERRQRMQAVAKQRSLPILHINTEDEVATQLVRWLGGRG